MKKIIHNNTGAFATWREEEAEETLVREMRSEGIEAEESLTSARLFVSLMNK